MSKVNAGNCPPRARHAARKTHAVSCITNQAGPRYSGTERKDGMATRSSAVARHIEPRACRQGGRGGDAELQPLANLTESFRGRDKLSNEYARTCGNTYSRITSDNASGTYILTWGRVSITDTHPPPFVLWNDIFRN